MGSVEAGAARWASCSWWQEVVLAFKECLDVPILAPCPLHLLKLGKRKFLNSLRLPWLSCLLIKAVLLLLLLPLPRVSSPLSSSVPVWFLSAASLSSHP